MRFDIYGRYQLEIRRVADAWVVYRPGEGTLVPLADWVIPAELDEAELLVFLNDLLHEEAEPGRAIRRVG